MDPGELPPAVARIGGRSRRAGGDQGGLPPPRGLPPPASTGDNGGAFSLPARTTLPTRSEPPPEEPKPAVADPDPASTSEEDSSDDEGEVTVTKAWLTNRFVSCGEPLECNYTLNLENLPPDDAGNVLEFLCYCWSRSLDCRTWEVVSRGVHTQGANQFIPTADDVGFFLRCEAGFDEQTPVPTEAAVCGISPGLRQDITGALNDSIRGFSLYTSHDGEPRMPSKIVMARSIVKLYIEGSGGKLKMDVKSPLTLYCKLTLSRENPSEFTMQLPNGTYKCTIDPPCCRDYFALIFRAFLGVSVEPLCSDVCTTEVAHLWRDVGKPFKIPQSKQSYSVEDYATDIDPDINAHSAEKRGLDWFLTTQTLQIVST